MKALPAGNYLVRPFITHKVQTYNYTFLSGSNPSQVTVDLGLLTPTGATWGFDPNKDPKNISGIYEKPLYASVQHLFYGTGSVWNGENKGWAPTGNIYVVSLAQQSYGESVQPGTFSLTSATATGSIVDNASGSLFHAATGTQLGNIFYSLGIAIVQQATGSATGSALSQNGLFLTSGSGVTVDFNATHTIYEHTVYCTMDSGEFNYSLNPSLSATGSVVGDPIKVLDLFASGTLTPYFTTIGLYSNKGELVALAKVPRAIKRAVESQQTVVVRFDV